MALAFCGASRAEDLKLIDRLVAQHGSAAFPGAWLRERGLAWAADLADSGRPQEREAA